jgi:ATP-binding protein involved in chromosome partitioning
MTKQNAQKSQCGGGGCGGGAAQALKQAVLDHSLSRIRNKLLIMSGKGGVGKSSVSSNLAVQLGAKGFRVGLMDVDLHGPSIAGMMGLSGMVDITEQRQMVPKAFNGNVKVISMQSLLRDRDQAVIWRGPAKNAVIRQFISDVKWDELDFLVIDSPPGTGDEPLSVVESIPGARAVIVTTPQEVALSDVRKSINFCRTVQMNILGLIENMGPFTCPCCRETISPFSAGGGEKMARDEAIPFLGSLPFDPAVVKACDTGAPIIANDSDSEFSKALSRSVDRIIELLG